MRYGELWSKGYIIAVGTNTDHMVAAQEQSWLLERVGVGKGQLISLSSYLQSIWPI